MSSSPFSTISSMVAPNAVRIYKIDLVWVGSESTDVGGIYHRFLNHLDDGQPRGHSVHKSYWLLHNFDITI